MILWEMLSGGAINDTHWEVYVFLQYIVRFVYAHKFTRIGAITIFSSVIKQQTLGRVMRIASKESAHPPILGFTYEDQHANLGSIRCCPSLITPRHCAWVSFEPFIEEATCCILEETSEPLIIPPVSHYVEIRPGGKSR